MPNSCSVPVALYSGFAEMPYCITAVPFQSVLHFPLTTELQHLRQVAQCYTLVQVLFVLPGWSSVQLGFFFFFWQICEEQECCLLLKWGPEQIVTFQHPYLVLLPYSIRPRGVLTLWWPARLLPWRLLFPSLSSERSGSDSGSWSGGDWLWPEQRNTARTVSKHCNHVNFPGVRMCKSLVFRAAVYQRDQWELLSSWNVKVNVSRSIISDVLSCGEGNLKCWGYK